MSVLCFDALMSWTGRAEDADLFDFNVQEGDLLVLGSFLSPVRMGDEILMISQVPGTDGVFDNLYVEEAGAAEKIAK